MQLILIYCCLILLARNMANKPAALLCGQICLAAVLGAGLAIGVQAITLAANGGIWAENTATKAGVLLALASPVVCVLTVLRFRSADLRFPMLFATLVFALSVCGSYRGPRKSFIWLFPLHLCMYVGLAACFALLASQLVMPTPSGLLARLSLGAALRSIGELAWAAVDLASGEVGRAGRLALASGRQEGGLDTGLLPVVMPLHHRSAAAGTLCTAAQTHTAAARWEVDCFRPTHVLPFTPFMELCVLARSLLSTATMLLYPIQSGTLHAACLHGRRGQLLAVATSLRDCCAALAACLETNQPIAEALQALERVHSDFLLLGQAVGRLPAELYIQPGALAMSSYLSLLFSTVARLRKVFRVLPAALARDQPRAVAETAACFCRLPDWDITMLADLEPQARGRDAMAVLRDSLLGADGGSPRGHSGLLDELLQSASHVAASTKEQLLVRLSQRDIATAERTPCPNQSSERRRSMLRRAGSVCQAALAALSVKPQQLQLTCQMLVCFLAVMFLEIAGSSYFALEGRPVWAMTIVVVLLEPSAGSSIRKAMLRLAGTLAGTAAGFAILYFVVLCNGLGHANHPQKFILTALLLALACGVSGAAAARTPRHTYMQITFCVIVTAVALVGYTQDAVLRPRLTQRSSLIVEQPDPAALHGGTRRTLLRALRQLRAPAGPELLAGCEHLLGPVYSRFFIRSMQASRANALVSGMAPLIPTLRFEWHPLEHPHRLPEEAAFRAQRLCRHAPLHCLNVLSAFAASMDAHHIQRVDLLAHHRAQMSGAQSSCRVTAKQLGESLRCLQAMVQGGAPPGSVVAGISSLQSHLERLLLLVVLHDLPAAGGSAWGTQGVAFLAMLFSLGWAVRRLAMALARTFWDPQAPALCTLAAELEDEDRWQRRLSAAAERRVEGLSRRPGFVSARMTTNDDKAFQAPPQPRQPPYHLLVPILYAPLLYTLRFALKGRVQPATQHRIFLGATAAALAHAGYILTDTTT
ncbi:hypothetical protein ABPG77_001707 [Micractinium sp. CCAP 211/92]